MATGMTMFIIFFIFEIALIPSFYIIGVFSFNQPFCKEGGIEFIPKSDCTGFYICADGHTYEQTCQDGWVFSHGAHGCVPRGSFIDDCENVTERCALDPNRIFPHDLECQLFYNCSNKNGVTFSIYMGAAGESYVSEPFLHECPYPQLFNPQILACDDFENVSCGWRHEIVNECQYWAHKSSQGSSGIPCSVFSPYCEGLPDGGNIYPYRQWSPYFINCSKGRTIESGYCPSLNISGLPSTQLFHPELLVCVPLYRIPEENGGLMPNCSSLPDGSYPTEFGSCSYFFNCVNGEFYDIYPCPAGTLFDVISRICVDQSTARCSALK